MHEAFSEQVPSNFNAWEHGRNEPAISRAERSGNDYDFLFIWRDAFLRVLGAPMSWTIPDS